MDWSVEKVVIVSVIIIIICFLFSIEMVSSLNTNELAAAHRYCSRDNTTDVVYNIVSKDGSKNFSIISAWAIHLLLYQDESNNFPSKIALNTKHLSFLEVNSEVSFNKTFEPREVARIDYEGGLDLEIQAFNGIYSLFSPKRCLIMMFLSRVDMLCVFVNGHLRLHLFSMFVANSSDVDIRPQFREKETSIECMRPAIHVQNNTEAIAARRDCKITYI